MDSKVLIWRTAKVLADTKNALNGSHTHGSQHISTRFRSKLPIQIYPTHIRSIQVHPARVSLRNCRCGCHRIWTTKGTKGTKTAKGECSRGRGGALSRLSPSFADFVVQTILDFVHTASEISG